MSNLSGAAKRAADSASKRHPLRKGKEAVPMADDGVEIHIVCVADIDAMEDPKNIDLKAIADGHQVFLKRPGKNVEFYAASVKGGKIIDFTSVKPGGQQ